MRVLYFTQQEIGGPSGGSILARQAKATLDNALKNSFVDEVLYFSLDNYPSKYSFDIKKSVLTDVASRLSGHSSFLFFPFLKYKKALLNYRPDIIIFGSSRFGFAARFFKKKLPNCRIVTFFENVEYDYCKNARKKWQLFLERPIVKKEEKKQIRYSNKCIFLTPRDLERAKSLYADLKNKKASIIPIMIREPNKLTLKADSPVFAFTGTLSYKPNADAARFIATFIAPFGNLKGAKFIIAGRNPSRELEDVCKTNNVQLIPNFQSIGSILPQHCCMLAPIFSGSGMKTKVSEGLANGMFLIGSEEAFVGYEAILQNKHPGICVCRQEEDFLSAVEKYIAIFAQGEKSKISDENIELFRQNYCIDYLWEKVWREICD